jgi:hypothetical protein
MIAGWAASRPVEGSDEPAVLRLGAAEVCSTIACLSESEAIHLRQLAKAIGRDDLTFRVLSSSRERGLEARRRLPWC